VAYTKLGLDRTVMVSYPQPGIRMSYIKLSGEPVGDGGDQYTGLDRFGRVVDNRWLNSSNVDVDRIFYTYSRASNRLTINNSVTGFDQSCSYDNLYQLIERTGTAPTEEFNYDPTGNWTSYVNGVNTQDRTHQKANEITGITGTPSATMAYDANGNTTTLPQAGNWSNTQTAVWDAWNRLVTVKQGTTILGAYQYDGLNRRTLKTSTEGGSTVTRHFYYSNQWQVLEERTGISTSAHRQYVWGTRYQDDLVLRDKFSGMTLERLYALADYFQTTAIANTSGVVVENYTYSAFGTPLSSSSYGWEYLFGSYYYDVESGLYQVRFRYYHSGFGRWLSRDPLPNAEMSQGPNLYEYVGNNPVNDSDDSGLSGGGGSQPRIFTCPDNSVKTTATVTTITDMQDINGSFLHNLASDAYHLLHHNTSDYPKLHFSNICKDSAHPYPVPGTGTSSLSPFMPVDVNSVDNSATVDIHSHVGWTNGNSRFGNYSNGATWPGIQQSSTITVCCSCKKQ